MAVSSHFVAASTVVNQTYNNPFAAASSGVFSTMKITSSVSATSSVTGALTVGNGAPATNTAIGGGNITTGGALTTGGNATVGGNLAAAYVLPSAATRGTLQDTSGSPMVANGAATISSGFGTSPSLVSSHSSAFKVIVGSAASGVGVVTLPTVTNGWKCSCEDITSNASITVGQTAFTTSSATFQAYSRTLGTTTSFTASDVLAFVCLPF